MGGMFFNIILFSITGLILSVETALYSILTYLVTAKITDLVIEGFEDFIGVTIVSKKYELLKEAIMLEVGAGMTLYQGKQGYGSQGTQEDFEIIHTIVNRIDIKKMYRVIDKIDQDAFIVEFDVNSIKGGVLRHYLNKSKNKKCYNYMLQSNSLRASAKLSGVSLGTATKISKLMREEVI